MQWSYSIEHLVKILWYIYGQTHKDNNNVILDWFGSTWMYYQIVLRLGLSKKHSTEITINNK